MQSALIEALESHHLRPVLIDNLGRDVLVFTRYGLALIDTDAAQARPGVIAEFIAAG